MAKKHAHEGDTTEHEVHETPEVVVNEVVNEDDSNEFTDESFGEDGVPTLKVGEITIAAPDKFAAGYVMTDTDAQHYSNFIRSRCSSNMLSLMKRNKRVWTPEDAIKYYEDYELGAPRSRGPSEETIIDESLERLLDEIAAKTGKSVPKGKGSIAVRDQLKEGLKTSSKWAERIAELQAEIRAEYAAKAEKPAAKADTISLEDLFA